jgi:uncharacterized protein
MAVGARKDDLGIKKTPCGKGLFARRQFRKGQTLGRMQGEVVTGDDYDPDYCVDLGKAGVLEPAAPFRFLNHCCEPNCELVEWQTDGDPEIWVYAVRTIRQGDELTIDYAWHADAAIPCLCGSERCRGYVVDERQLHLVRRKQRGRRRTASAAR